MQSRLPKFDRFDELDEIHDVVCPPAVTRKCKLAVLLELIRELPEMGGTKARFSGSGDNVRLGVYACL